jgi:hypothetical protein
MAEEVELADSVSFALLVMLQDRCPITGRMAKPQIDRSLRFCGLDALQRGN